MYALFVTLSKPQKSLEQDLGKSGRWKCSGAGMVCGESGTAPVLLEIAKNRRFLQNRKM